MSNFRNHQAQNFEINSNVIAIYGKNGSGKTNILEAVSLLVQGRGLRNAKLLDLGHFNGQEQFPWAIFCAGEGKNGDVEIGCGIDVAKDKKTVKIDGEKQRAQSSLNEHFSVLWLTPGEDQTFSSGSTSRREFLDRICTFFYPDYSNLLNAFKNLKSQRRNLLSEYKYDEYWVDSVEQGMVEKSIAIAHLRNEAIKNLNHTIQSSENYGFPFGRLSILGEIENFLISSSEKNADQQQDAEQQDAEQFYKDILKQNRLQDAKTHRTNNGIHRSDFRVIHSNKNMPTELCSQGEQKAMLLSITIAAILAKKMISGVTPILLLDEVYSHLDTEKRQQLYKFISNTECQTWLTGTEKESFDGLENCQFISL